MILPLGLDMAPVLWYGVGVERENTSPAGFPGGHPWGEQCPGGAQPCPQGLSVTSTPQPPISQSDDAQSYFTEEEKISVKDFLLGVVNPPPGAYYPVKDRLRAAATLFPSMYPKLTALKNEHAQPVTFVFMDIQGMAKARLEAEEAAKQARKRIRRDIVDGVEVIDA